MANPLPPDPPNPGAVAPLRPHDWSRYRRSWTDDQDDCISSSFEEALRLQYGEAAPDLPDFEAAYRRWHPDWTDSPETMVLAWYWDALYSIGVYVEALHQRGEIVDQIVAALDAGFSPTAWVYLWNAYTGSWLHHAIVAVAHYDNWLVFYDPQRGFGWEYDKDLFRQTGLDGATSGYAYRAAWESVEVPVPTTDELKAEADRAADRHGVDRATFARLITQESGWDPAAVNPTSGAYGLGQFIPRWYPDARSWDPYTQLDKAAAILANNLAAFDGDYPLTVAAYNGGVAALSRWRDEYGADWRAALTLYPERWPDVASYGTAAKAGEVERYLRAIIDPGQGEHGMSSAIVDLRGKLPTRGAYSKRPVSGITTVTYHYTAGSYDGTVRSIADWQISDGAAGQFGGQPAPGIAYTGIVKGDGAPHWLWDLDVRVWHAGNPWNDTSIGICYIGNSKPRTAQIEGLAQLHVWCERQLGRQLGVRGHKDAQATDCPGDWPYWKVGLVEAINRARQPEPTADRWAEMHNAAKTLVLVTEPGRTQMPDGSELTEERSLGEVGRILQLVNRHRAALAGDT